MSHAIIYTATDTRNGRVYVGQTWAGLEERKHCHVSLAVGTPPAKRAPFHRALLKAGSHFVWEIVAHAWTQEHLDTLECKWIEKLQSMIDQRGYNMRSGGRNGYRMTDEVRAKVSATKTGVPRSDAHRARQSKISKAMPKTTKLSRRARYYIRLNPQGMSYAALATFFGVSVAHVGYIRVGRRETRHIARVTREKIDFDYVLSNPDQLTNKQLAEKFAVGVTMISWIRNKHVTNN